MQRTSPKCPWADSEEGAVTLEQPQGKSGAQALQGKAGVPHRNPGTPHSSPLGLLLAGGGGWSPRASACWRGWRECWGYFLTLTSQRCSARARLPPGCQRQRAPSSNLPPSAPSPQPEHQEPRKRVLGPAAGTHLSRALRHGAPAPPGVPARGPRGPRYSGRRPAGSAPPRQKICWAGWLVLSGVLSPRGAAGRRDSPRPRLGVSPVLTGVTVPSSAGLGPRSRLSLGLSLPAGPAESGPHAPPLPRPYSGAGVSRLPSSSPSPEPCQTAGHCPLPPGPGLTLLLSRSLGEGWTPGSRGQRRQPVPATCPFLLANPNWCTPPTVKPDKPRVGVSTEKGFLQRRTRRLMLKRLQLPGGFQVFLKQGEEESHRVCADQLWDKSLIG